MKKGDVLIIECEKGKENLYLSRANEELKALIIEKDLRVLAVTPDFDTDSLYTAIDFVKNFN